MDGSNAYPEIIVLDVCHFVYTYIRRYETINAGMYIKKGWGCYNEVLVLFLLENWNPLNA